MNKGIGIAILIGLGLFLFFVTKKGLSAPALSSGCGTCQPLKLMPAGSLKQEAGLLHYKNKETRIIEWDKDLVVPTKFVIEREYYQLP